LRCLIVHEITIRNLEKYYCAIVLQFPDPKFSDLTHYLTNIFIWFLSESNQGLIFGAAKVATCELANLTQFLWLKMRFHVMESVYASKYFLLDRVHFRK